MTADQVLPWLQTAQALATIVIAGVAVRIAAERKNLAGNQVEIAQAQRTLAATQTEISKNKLRLELFDRRQRVYNQVREALSEVLTGGAVYPDIRERIRLAYLDSHFLFSDELIQHLRELYETAALVEQHNQRADRLEGGEQQHELDEEFAAKQKLINQLVNDDEHSLKAKFRPFMDITDQF